MEDFRKVVKIVTARPVTEGAGVRLRRAIGLGNPEEFDPFLLLDDFRSDTPADYRAGFPWHPHRGIETVTYVLKGTVEHGDSTGTRGAIGAGDIQWMTAGSGIFHQEMPKGDDAGSMHGFQLWVNLCARDKMTAPRYRGISASEIPAVTIDGGIEVKVIAGAFGGVSGPVADVATRPTYLDVFIPADGKFVLETKRGDTAFLYVHEGECLLESGDAPGDAAGSAERGARAKNRELALFSDGDGVTVRSGPSGARFIFVSGTPLREPIAWRGPIVMNTQEELKTAWAELDAGTFVKAGSGGGITGGRAGGGS